MIINKPFLTISCQIYSKQYISYFSSLNLNDIKKLFLNKFRSLSLNKMKRKKVK